jgi:serine/threonine-protein kinase
VTEPRPIQRSLGGKYVLLEPLGRGGMGSVWVAEHLTLHSLVAVKLIEARVASNPDNIARFVREARAAAALRSPHVVQILDHGIDDGTPYIVMELLEGETLARRLERVGRLDPRETSRILTQVARAVSRAHEAGIVHRDLKPDNIFLVDNDDEEIAKVLDFGIAKASATGSEVSGVGTQSGAFVGTPSYMSPEQAEGMRVDTRTDLWALGVIAFECLVGARPFTGEGIGGLVLKICSRPLPVPSQLASVPEEFDAWFARACARILDERFQDAKEQAAELRRICEGSTMTAEPAVKLPASIPAEATGTPVSSEGPTHAFWERDPKPLVPPKRNRRRIAVAFVAATYALVMAVVVARRANRRVEANAVAPAIAAPAPPAEPAAVDTPPTPSPPALSSPIAAASEAPPIASAARPAVRRVPATRHRAPPPSPPPATPLPAPPPPTPVVPEKVNLGI